MENSYTKTFGKYACEGNTITAEKDGFTIAARIMRDDCSDAPNERQDGFYPSKDKDAAGYCPPEHFDASQAHAEKVMKAWKNDEWFYCGIVLSVSKAVHIKGRVQDEIVVSDHAASLWGIECNYPDSDNAYLTEVANELLDEALDHAKECLKQIAA